MENISKVQIVRGRGRLKENTERESEWPEERKKKAWKLEKPLNAENVLYLMTRIPLSIRKIF